MIARPGPAKNPIAHQVRRPQAVGGINRDAGWGQQGEGGTFYVGHRFHQQVEPVRKPVCEIMFRQAVSPIHRLSRERGPLLSC